DYYCLVWDASLSARVF
nr:immunoglobulin light chain junction region [Macaca mulatta]